MDAHREVPPRSRLAVGLWYFSLLAMANLIWSAQGIAVKVLSPPASQFSGPVLGPVAITFLPFYVTTLLLIPLLFWQRRRNPGAVRPSGGDWWKFAVAGIGGQVLAQLGMTWGIKESLASNSSILNLMIPVLSAILASVMLGERVTRLRVLCLVIGLFGVVLMSVGDFRTLFGTLRDKSSLTPDYLVGNLLILAGCFGSSFYNVYCKGLLARFQEVEILIFSYITASLFSVPLLIWLEPLDLAPFSYFDGRMWAAFVFLALLMYGVSMLLFFHVLEHLPVTVASMSLYLIPVFGVLLATTILGESLGPLSLCGAAVVLVSTVLIMRYDTAA